MSEPNLNDILSGGGLSSLLQNPEVAAKLPRIMEALGPVIAEMREEGGKGEGENANTGSGEDKKEQSAGSGGDILAALPALQGLSGKGKNSSSAHRRALLCALEPYLSDNRREAMGHISKVLSLIDILSEVM